MKSRLLTNYKLYTGTVIANRSNSLLRLFRLRWRAYCCRRGAESAAVTLLSCTITICRRHNKKTPAAAN
ncbi:hypothetical protein GOP47_0012317 [Adiantum capillus-veneris]|uniref:Uncharacterized protein n=1 Tax=Adiantum capillus-veneris TaxID=13818 RepID=A0A9D4UR59_ADICA|nr:hypothetical protein GOP47_0012317 [Adiantum capillus-veneris]